MQQPKQQLKRQPKQQHLSFVSACLSFFSDAKVEMGDNDNDNDNDNDKDNDNNIYYLQRRLVVSYAASRLKILSFEKYDINCCHFLFIHFKTTQNSNLVY